MLTGSMVISYCDFWFWGIRRVTWINARRYRSDVVRSEAMKLLVVGLLALSTGACSFSFGLSALDDEEPKSTGTVTARADTPLSADLDQEDWRRAKAALAVAL